MGRYPFTECVNEYLPVEEGHVSKETLDTTYRRLMQIGRIFHSLKAEGRVSSDNPKSISAADIDAFIGYRKKNRIKETTILKDLAYLTKFLGYYDNGAVAKFKARYPAHVPKKFQKRLPSMEERVVQKILDRASEIPVSNWKMMEAYGLVSLAICTGFRPKELRMLSAKDVFVNGDFIEIHAIHVKGEDRYGTERWVTVHPDGTWIFRNYLEARRIRLAACNKEEDALFPPIVRNGGYVSYKMIRTLKTFVEEDIGEAFELRKCRRTFGQRALNEGQDIHDVSIVMGHSTLATTQRYYCDKDQRVASAEMRKFWRKNDKIGGIEER